MWGMHRRAEARLSRQRNASGHIKQKLIFCIGEDFFLAGQLEINKKIILIMHTLGLI